MPTVRELSAEETGLAHAALVELRPHFADLDDFLHQVNDLQRPEGYRLLASFENGEEDAAAVAGFRTGNNLPWRSFLYVDDLITREGFRGRGHADALMQWLFREARRLGCDQLHLDSATHRHPAHRFYLKHGMAITAFHLQADIVED